MHCIFYWFNVIIVTMTNWLPDLPRTGAPLYVEIADAMQRDIDGGVLSPGEKLPPERVGRVLERVRERWGEVGYAGDYRAWIEAR